MSRDESNLVIKVMIVKELMTGDVSPVAMFKSLSSLMVAMLRYDLCESSLALKFALRHMTMFSVRPRPKNEEKLINKQSLQNFTDLQTNIYIYFLFKKVCISIIK